jgi:histidine phosphotransferase ChpT
LEDEKDPEMRAVALDLIKRSAASASSRLQFCRLAFGAAGSMGASIDTGDAETVTRGLIASERTALAWNPPRQFAPKNKVKLLLNLCLIAQSTIPRGGVISVDLSGQDDSLAMRVQARGVNPRLATGVADLVAGRPESGAVDAHSIQPYFAGLVARECGMEVAITVEAESVTFEARPTGAKA